MATQDEIIVLLRAQTKQFETSLDKVNDRLDKLGKNSKKQANAVNKAFGGLQKKALGLLAAFASFKTLQFGAGLIKGVIQAGSEVEKTEKSLAGLINATTQFRDETGKAVSPLDNLNASLEQSGRLYKELQASAAGLAGITTQDLLSGATFALPELGKAGITDVKQQADLIGTLTASLKQLGLAQNEIQQKVELRAFLGGDITKVGADFAQLVAQLNGGTEAFKRNFDEAKRTGQLYQFLSSALQPFAANQKLAADSVDNNFSVIQDGIDRTQQAIGQELTPSLKELQKGIIDVFFEDGPNGTKVFNEELQEITKELGTNLASALTELKPLIRPTFDVLVSTANASAQAIEKVAQAVNVLTKQFDSAISGYQKLIDLNRTAGGFGGAEGRGAGLGSVAFAAARGVEGAAPTSLTSTRLGTNRAQQLRQAFRDSRPQPTLTAAVRGASGAGRGRGGGGKSDAQTAEQQAQKEQERIAARVEALNRELKLTQQITALREQGGQRELETQQQLADLNIEETRLQAEKQTVAEQLKRKELTQQEANERQKELDIALRNNQLQKDSIAISQQEARVKQQISALSLKLNSDLQAVKGTETERAAENAKIKAEYEQQLATLQRQLKKLSGQKEEIAKIAQIDLSGLSKQVTTPLQDAKSQSQGIAQSIQGNFQQAAQGIGQSLSGAFQGGEFSAKKFAESALNTVLNLVTSIASSFLSAGLGGGGGGGGGFLSGLVGSFFAEGGYTGHGGKYQPAGIVHKGEGVLTKAEVAKLGGPLAFDRLRRNIRGYAGGGIVGPSRSISAGVSRPSSAMGGNMGGVVINIQSLDSQDTLRVLKQPEVQRYLGNNSVQATQRKANESFNRSPYEFARGTG